MFNLMFNPMLNLKFRLFFAALICFALFSAAGAKAQTVTAPALEPSKAKKLRSAREDAEIQTESAIVEKLEAERLKDEQSRMDSLFGSSPPKAKTAGEALSPPAPAPAAAPAPWSFGNKAFVFGGIGVVQYLTKSADINSTETPAWSFGFGGYGANHIIIDLTGHYSEHLIKETHTGSRLKVIMVSPSMSVKYSPFSWRFKPYAGLSAAYVLYRHRQIDAEGNDLLEHQLDPHDKSRKQWVQAFDGGAAIGGDLALAGNLGINLDIRVHKNLWTESAQNTALDKKGYVVFSGNLKYYF